MYGIGRSYMAEGRRKSSCSHDSWPVIVNIFVGFWGLRSTSQHSFGSFCISVNVFVFAFPPQEWHNRLKQLIIYRGRKKICVSGTNCHALPSVSVDFIGRDKEKREGAEVRASAGPWRGQGKAVFLPAEKAVLFTAWKRQWKEFFRSLFFTCLFIYLRNIYLPKACYVSDVVLGPKDIAVNKISLSSQSGYLREIGIKKK